MINLSTKETFDSESCDGVKFTVRTLNVIQRARRDSRIAEHRIRYTDLLEEYKSLPDDERTATGASELIYRISLVLNEHLIPASLEAGLMAVEGVEIDNIPATAKTLIEDGPDELLMEIFERCEEAAGLSGDDSKNSQLPGTSAGQGDGESESSTAENASGESST